MKKLALCFVLVLAYSATVYARDISPCEGVSVKTLKEHVPLPKCSILSKREVGGLCEVILDIGGQYVPVYATREFVIAGELFKDRTQVTQGTIAKLKAERFVKLREEVEKSVAMVLEPTGKKATKTVYMITDPLCPYCDKAGKQIQKLAEQHGARFKIVFYSIRPPVSERKAVEAICRGLSAEKYLEGSWKTEGRVADYQCEKGKELVRRGRLLAHKLGVRGVPVFYLSDGRLVEGANMKALVRALSLRDEEVTVSYTR